VSRQRTAWPYHLGAAIAWLCGGYSVARADTTRRTSMLEPAGQKRPRFSRSGYADLLGALVAGAMPDCHNHLAGYERPSAAGKGTSPFTFALVDQFFENAGWVQFDHRTRRLYHPRALPRVCLQGIKMSGLAKTRHKVVAMIATFQLFLGNVTLLMIGAGRLSRAHKSQPRVARAALCIAYELRIHPTCHPRRARVVAPRE